MTTFQHFPYIESAEGSGHFKCKGQKVLHSSDLIPVEVYYQDHVITEDGKMQASYSYKGDKIVHNFEMTEFCLEHKQVLLKNKRLIV